VSALDRDRWNELCRGARSEAAAQWYDRLLELYSEPHRHYHNAQHITDCLKEFDSVRDAAQEPLAVELAIWFHDAIYNPRAGDNEERSAELAAQFDEKIIDALLERGLLIGDAPAFAELRDRDERLRERASGEREVLPSKCHDVKVFPGDVLHFVTWGGGGWGDPLERDPALVELEVRRGLVTDEGARRYGVVVGDSGVDAAATEALRAELRAARPAELPVFDMGPPIEELLERCEAETGLPAPKRPQWA